MDVIYSDTTVENGVNNNSENTTSENASLEDGVHARPLTITLERLDQTRNGYFRPGAFIKLTSSLRTSGFLQAIPAEELKNLLFLLTFLSPNGDCRATVLQLADAMQVSQAKVRSRMQRLERFVWRDRPIVTYLSRESGLDGYAIAPHVAHVQQAEATAPEAVTQPIIVAPRETVIAYSRQRYARPRAEVERMIAEQNGWELPEDAADDETVQVRRRLLSVGVSKEQVNLLMDSFDLARIQRQLDWLPYRNARIPAHFIVAAIQGDYEEPCDSRMRRLMAPTAEATTQEPEDNDTSTTPVYVSDTDYGRNGDYGSVAGDTSEGNTSEGNTSRDEPRTSDRHYSDRHYEDPTNQNSKAKL